MKSIEDLRDWAKHYNATGCRDIRMFADAIETELAERYVALPLGADGEPIRVGDVVIAQLLFGGESKPLVVDRMELSRGRDGDLWCVALDTDEGCWNQPSILRHHRPPTVEDVLREFADEVRRCCDTADTIAEYAAKLRIAGEDE